MTRRRGAGAGAPGRHRSRGAGARPVLRRGRAGPAPHPGARVHLPGGRREPGRRRPGPAYGPPTRGSRRRFQLATVPPLPSGSFDVVLLLETLLAFRDKPALLHEVASVLARGGRFACTLEEGLPLTAAEAALMPGSDTVWLTPLARLRVRPEPAPACGSAGASRPAGPTGATVDALVDAYAAAAPELRERVPGGPPTTSSPRTASGAGGCTTVGCASSPSSPRRWRPDLFTIVRGEGCRGWAPTR